MYGSSGVKLISTSQQSLVITLFLIALLHEPSEAYTYCVQTCWKQYSIQAYPLSIKLLCILERCLSRWKIVIMSIETSSSTTAASSICSVWSCFHQNRSEKHDLYLVSPKQPSQSSYRSVHWRTAIASFSIIRSAFSLLAAWAWPNSLRKGEYKKSLFMHKLKDI